MGETGIDIDMAIKGIKNGTIIAYPATALAELQAENKQQAEQLKGQIELKDRYAKEGYALRAENQRLKELVYRMCIINPNGYPKPMEKMIADIYNEKQEHADEEYEQEKDYDS